MPNKSWENISPLDRAIRLALPVGMNDGVHLTIEFFSGFELFNTRPYHNYETWSDGYRITGQGITIEREDLDEAVQAWVDALKEKKEKP